MKPKMAKIIDESDGFAEIYPEDKYKIVKLLQSSGHMVGMTGDGVNDAPALKQAELGIAVSSSTDVAKASASMVLTEPGVAVIIEALKTSRHIYQRMLNWVINKVTKVIQVICLPDHRLFLVSRFGCVLAGNDALNICQRLRHHESGDLITCHTLQIRISGT